MKTALEIAMERFGEEGETATAPLDAEQKAQLKEVDRVINSKIAEKKILFEHRVQDARRSGDFKKVDELQEELARELSRLESDREAQKERIRKGE